MEATHKLVELSCGDEWLLRCTGSEHWWCKIIAEDAAARNGAGTA